MLANKIYTIIKHILYIFRTKTNLGKSFEYTLWNITLDRLYSTARLCHIQLFAQIIMLMKRSARNSGFCQNNQAMNIISNGKISRRAHA